MIFLVSSIRTLFVAKEPRETHQLSRWGLYFDTLPKMTQIDPTQTTETNNNSKGRISMVFINNPSIRVEIDKISSHPPTKLQRQKEVKNIGNGRKGISWRLYGMWKWVRWAQVWALFFPFPSPRLFFVFLSQTRNPHPRTQMFSWSKNGEQTYGYLGDVEIMVMVNSMYRGEGTENRMFVFEKGWNGFFDG